MTNEQIDKLLEALAKIALLNPHDDSHEINEWGEADCFHIARQTAQNALSEVNFDLDAAAARKYGELQND